SSTTRSPTAPSSSSAGNGSAPPSSAWPSSPPSSDSRRSPRTTPGSICCVCVTNRSVTGRVRVLALSCLPISGRRRLASMGSPGSAQQDRFVGGSQVAPLRLAEQLGDRVRLGVPVRRIEQRNSGATVHADGVDVAAARVIVAVPPTLAGRIVYDPPLPARRDQ